MEKVSHPALTMWDITTPSEEAAAVDAARGVAVQAAAAGGGGSTTTVADTAVAVAEPPATPSAPPATTIAASTAGTTPPATKTPAAAPSAGAIPASDGVGPLIALLEQLRNAPPATEIQPGMTPMQQMAVLQASTAMHLLHAGANMLLMQTGMLAAAAPAYRTGRRHLSELPAHRGGTGGADLRRRSHASRNPTQTGATARQNRRAAGRRRTAHHLGSDRVADGRDRGSRQSQCRRPYDHSRRVRNPHLVRRAGRG